MRRLGLGNCGDELLENLMLSLMKNACAVAILLSLFFVFSTSEADARRAVGVILPLSGGLAEFGTAMRNGIALAERDSPNSQCTFKFEDSMYDSKTAISAFRKLTEIEKVKVVYSFGGPMAAALAPLTNGREVLLVTSETEPSFSIGYDNVIRFNVPSEELAKVQAAGIVSGGFRKVGMIIIENEYFNGIDRALRKVLPSDVTVEEIARLQPGANELRSVVTRLRNKKFDVVGIALFGDLIPVFYREMQLQSLNFPTFSLQGLENELVLKTSGPKIIGATFASTSTEDSFQKRYQREFGNRDQIAWAGFAFDFANIVLHELCSSLQNSTSEIRLKLKAVRGAGVSGNYHFIETKSGDKYFSFPVMLKEVREDGLISAAMDNNRIQQTVPGR